MKFIYSKYFIYIVFILSILTLFLSITNIFNHSNEKIRNLSDDTGEGLEKICKVNDDIYNYYYKTGEYKFSDEDFGKMNDASNIILDFLTNNFDTKYIFDYIWKTKKYVFFLILLIIIIILTIYYSIASCVRCCTEKCCDFFSFSCCKNVCFKKTICVCIPFIYLIVFVLAVLSIIFGIAVFERFSGSICVAFQLVDTFIEGELRNVLPKWSGVLVVSNILQTLGNITSENYTNLVNDINNNMQDYFKNLEIWNKLLESSHLHNTGKNFTVISPKMSKTDTETEVTLSPIHSYIWGPHNKAGTVLFDIDKFDAENTERISFVNSIFENFLYSFLGCSRVGNKMECGDVSLARLLYDAGNITKGIQEPLSKIKTKIAEPINNIYQQVNTTIIGIFGVIIFFVILYCILIEILLSIFCCAKSNKCLGSCLKWTLCFIYYTSIFIIIIGFVIGIVVGVIGSVVQDMTKVVEFITSHENLDKENPIIFGKDYSEYLDVCFNTGGDLAEKLGLKSSFKSIDNIVNITDDTEKLINKTTLSSPMIDYYLQYMNNFSVRYLDYQYYNVGDNNKTLFNITERLKEINNYVSGEYATTKEDACLINETWATLKEKSGYEYDDTYPEPSDSSRYLIYLYDKGLYDKVNFANRYDKACPTNGHPYEKVSEASSKFSELFKKIGKSINENLTKDYIDDLNELNKIFNRKNQYLIKTLNNADKPINNIVKSITGYISGNESAFDLLNCKFVGENKKILMDILYTSLGVYLDYFGVMTVLFSLFLFIGIIFILIVIKNTGMETNRGNNSQYLQSLDDIWKGNNLYDPYLQSNLPTQELMKY